MRYVGSGPTQTWTAPKDHYVRYRPQFCTSRVESRRGAVAVGFRWRWPALSRRRLNPACRGSVSPPRSSNRTCRFPASGSPTGFTSRPTAWSKMHADEVQDAKLPEHDLGWEALRASPLHLATMDEEVELLSKVDGPVKSQRLAVLLDAVFPVPRWISRSVFALAPREHSCNRWCFSFHGPMAAQRRILRPRARRLTT